MGDDRDGEPLWRVVAGCTAAVVLLTGVMFGRGLTIEGSSVGSSAADAARGSVVLIVIATVIVVVSQRKRAP